MTVDRRGFALVEALVIVLALSIVISLGVMLFFPHHDPTRAEQCHRDAEEFQTAVNTWHENDEKKLWPGENDKSIALDLRGVALALDKRGFLNEDSFEHLDGSMKHPVTLEKGWTYDFKTHQVDDAGCDSR
jgi:hypothetical protein